jgi:neutral ceramidase
VLRRAAIAAALIGAAAAPASASAAGLSAGVGRADITPPTGYFMQGWVRSDAKVTGAQTRLYARVLVLRQGGHKVALVAEDLNGIAGGVLAAAAQRVHNLGYSQANVIDSASHTHAAPTGYFNFSTYNTVFMTTGTPSDANLTGALDPVLYAFEVRQLARAIARADRNLGPAVAGWAQTKLLGVTQNRSIEAHLADHGIKKEFGTGSVKDDPGGYPETIDPAVDVLRVDKVRLGRRVPVGMWSNFADHGTVNKYTFHYYNADHHGAATRDVEYKVRTSGHVPHVQDVVNVYGNSDEGDVSAGLHRSGPAAADYVGRRETASMIAAWRTAGHHLSGTLPLAERWTRVCMCGQSTHDGPVDSTAVVGLPLLTGSEEGRGPLFDVTHQPFEGRTSPVDFGPQGDKIQTLKENGSVPKAVPLAVVRFGDRLIVTVPGEMTVEMARRVRASVLQAAAGSGVHRVVISGLANEYLSYFTTPEEYSRQHYEGGSTLYGRTSSVVLQESLADLAARLAQGRAAPVPYAYDPTNGVADTSGPFPLGAGRATSPGQPADVRRLEHTHFRWTGGQRGFDRPLEAPFVTVEGLLHNRWRLIDNDIGQRILWKVDSNGRYDAEWEPAVGDPPRRYRFRITANRYRITSRSFTLRASRALTLRRDGGTAGRVGLALDYPPARVEIDLTYRPRSVDRGRIVVRVNGRRVVVTRARSGRFLVPARPGAHVVVPAGAARDRYGNVNGRAFSFTA